MGVVRMQRRSSLQLHSRMPTRRTCVIAILASFFGFAILLLSRSDETAIRPLVGPLWKSHKRKGVVLASQKKDNITWMESIPDDWETYRYVVDDPSAKYTVAKNQGREAMPYITFINDHYDNLPDYMVFSHGHERAWHQPAPFHYHLRALNLPLLDELGWTSLRCSLQNTCEKEAAHVFPHKSSAWELSAILIRMHEVIFMPQDAWYEPLPEDFAVPCCSQFAVTKRQVHTKPKAYWERLHTVLSSDFDKEYPLWEFGTSGAEKSWVLGGLFEFTWPWWFSMPSVVCPSTDYCWQEVFQNKIRCDGDTWDYITSQATWKHITCTLDD